MDVTRSVAILDDDEDLRVTLGEVMEGTCEVECVTLSDVASMIRDGERVLACALAILDINLGPGQPSGLDARNWLIQHGFPGRIVFLTGHAAMHPLVQAVMASGGAMVLTKPVSAKELCACLDEP